MEYFETVPLSYFIDELMLLDGIEQPMAEDYARRAIIDFATKTHVIKRHTTVELIACANEYILEVPPCERVIKLLRVCGDYTIINREPCTLSEPQSCGSRHVWFVPPNSFMLNPAPSNSEGEVRVVAITAPKRDCCEVDKIFYEEHRDAIIDKALSSAYMIKSARWFDLNLYKTHELAYREAIAYAKYRKMLGNHSGKIQIRPRRDRG